MNILWMVQLKFRDDSEWWNEEALPRENQYPIYHSKGDAIAAGVRLKLLNPAIKTVRVCIVDH